MSLNEFSKNSSAFLQVNVLLGYNQLCTMSEILEVGYGAHSRRKFIEAKGSDPGNVHVALVVYSRVVSLGKYLENTHR